MPPFQAIIALVELEGIEQVKLLRDECPRLFTGAGALAMNEVSDTSLAFGKTAGMNFTNNTNPQWVSLRSEQTARFIGGGPVKVL
jgi:hypothetical protein